MTKRIHKYTLMLFLKYALIVVVFIVPWFFVFDLVDMQKHQQVKQPAPSVADPFMGRELVINVKMKFETIGGGYKYIPINQVKVTAYNNLPEQTNAQPNIGASNRKVFEGSVAVSRDILRDYKVKYGDVLCLVRTKQCYFIEDTMNKRYDGENGKHVDIFMYSKDEALRVHNIDDAVILQQL